MSELRIYLVVRTDLKMGKGKIAAQCGHAVEYLVTTAPKPIIHEYRKHGHPKVALKASSLEELQDLKDLCSQKNILYHLVEDAGRTQVPEGSFTVLGIGPVREENLPKQVNALKLL